jgi:peptide/nickel transport system permease protein
MNIAMFKKSPMMSHLKSSKIAMLSVIFIIAVMFLAVLAPVIANDVPIFAVHDGRLVFPVFFESDRYLDADGYSRAIYPPVRFGPGSYDINAILQPPSKLHLFGTDGEGRDVFAMFVWGSRISVSVGLVAMGIAAAIGIIMGLLAGFFGGWVDIVIMRFLEIMMCFPTFFLILAILAFVGPSIYNIMLVIGLTGWTPIARLTRGEVLRLRTLPFVSAAYATGRGRIGIMKKHILPNALSPILVTVSFGIAAAMLAEASLSFLGFGVPPDVSSWGGMLADARNYMGLGWWLTLIPGSAIFLTVASYNFAGEAIRDFMDPHKYAINRG